jgi:hypothetical protein
LENLNGLAALAHAGQRVREPSCRVRVLSAVLANARRIPPDVTGVLSHPEDLRNTLVTLLAESALNYVQLRGFQRQFQVAQDNLKAQRDMLDLSLQLYRNGRTDFLSVLDAQRSLYAAQTALTQGDTALSADMVTLYKALGGGWE